MYKIEDIVMSVALILGITSLALIIYGISLM